MATITPAILSSSIEDIQKKIINVNKFTKWIQIDIMDGQFVSEKSITVSELKNLKYNPAKLEAHLMVQQPDQYISDCIQVGVQRIIIHCEADNVHNAIELIEKHSNIEVGIALNPETPVSAIAPFVNDVQLILLLAVQPGKQGQAFLPQTLQKIHDAKQFTPGVPVAIDGGINKTNIQGIINAGTDICCIGSAVFQAKNPEKALRHFQQLAHKPPMEA